MTETKNVNSLYYQPQRYWVGDMMPWGKDGKFYIYDQRDNRNPGPFGEPFSWSLATTKDFVKFEDHGIAIERGKEDDVDQFIYAGSVFEAKGKGHAFYTGYNRDLEKAGKTSQVLLHAYSDDLIHWEKSNQLLKLVPQPGYDDQEWRDPWVIWNDEKQEYLLILGARLKGPKTKMTGRVVHFTSKDLENWEFKGDFWASDQYTMIEMPDLFKMGDWWYLVYTEYSEQSKTRYVMSQSLEGPWIIPDDDAFDGRAYYAARSAFDGQRRVLFGWVATKENEDDKASFQWAGALVPHEIYQREDHTLAVKPVDSLWNAFEKGQQISNVTIQAKDKASEKIIVDPIDACFAFEATFSYKTRTNSFGIRLFKNQETDESYEFRISIKNKELSFDKSPCYPWPPTMNKGLQRPLHLEAEKDHHLQMIVDGSIFTLYIDGVALNVRGYHPVGKALAIAVTDGEITFKEMKYANEIKR